MAAKEKKNKVFVDYGRQLDIFNPENFTDILTVIGAGGIGSPTVIVLSKIGCPRIEVYDPDTIELHNLPNQFFRHTDLDRKKVEALKEIVEELTGTVIEVHPKLYVDQPFAPGIVISAVDKMEQRKAIWKKVKMNPSVKLFIDARMGGEVARIYAINPVDLDEVNFYEKTLYSDEEASTEKCTAKAIMYNVFVIAGIIGDLVKKRACRQNLPKEILVDLVTLSMVTKWKVS